MKFANILVKGNVQPQNPNLTTISPIVGHMEDKFSISSPTESTRLVLVDFSSSAPHGTKGEWTPVAQTEPGGEPCQSSPSGIILHTLPEGLAPLVNCSDSPCSEPLRKFGCPRGIPSHQETKFTTEKQGRRGERGSRWRV